VKAPAPAKKHEFKAGDFVVYPTHGVGRIQKVDEQEVAGLKLELFVIAFEKDKMILRVPTTKAKAVACASCRRRTWWRRRSTRSRAGRVSSARCGAAALRNTRPRSIRAISFPSPRWFRDLHRASGQPEQSYSERQLYEAALARMAREVAAIERIDEQAAVENGSKAPW
jgi:CarD family transcriptional regulator